MHHLKMLLPLLAAFYLLPLCSSFARAPQNAEVHVIRMTAKKYAFSPDTITVRKGDPVKLIVTALDRDHGFKLAAFHIDDRLRKGVPTTIEFTPDKSGTFSFKCSVFCGMGHRHMRGKLVVTGN